ncbi:hypothetical protein LTR85_010618 [Meristemomyces frigidus]|nr:hypothetical protein LTR85_010618 [Meristemomyces frigidus]
MASQGIPEGQQSMHDHLSTLPNELLLQIASYLTGTDDPIENRRVVFAKISVCKTLRAIAETFLFEDIVLTINLTDELPPARAPLRWADPPARLFLQQNPHLASCVKSLRLRIEPFPFEEWTSKRCSEVISGLKGCHVLSLGPYMIRHPRQDRVASAHCRRIFECCRDEGWRQRGQPVAEDATRVVTDVLRLLPNLRHVKVAPWRSCFSTLVNTSAQWFRDVTFARNLSIAYGTHLLLTTSPACVKSLRITSAESQRVHHELLPGEYSIASGRDGVTGAPDWLLDPGIFLPDPVGHFHVRLSTFASQLTSLHVDIHRDAFAYWPRILQSLLNITRLGLRSADEADERAVDDMKIFLEPLVMPRVTHLELTKWVATRSFLLLVPQRNFVALRQLRLHSIILHAEWKDAWNRCMWAELVRQLRAGNSTLQVLKVEEPLQIGRYRYSLGPFLEPRALYWSDSEELEDALKQQWSS